VTIRVTGSRGRRDRARRACRLHPLPQPGHALPPL